jgi:hypothetical protein
MSDTRSPESPVLRSRIRSISGDGLVTMRPIHAILAAAAVSCPLAALAGSLVR